MQKFKRRVYNPFPMESGIYLKKGKERPLLQRHHWIYSGAIQFEIAEVDGIELHSMDAKFPIASAQGGTPDVFANVTEQKVRFNKYGGATGTELKRLEYDYMRVPAALTSGAAEEPAIPLQYRRIIPDYALMFLHMDKNDDRAPAVGLMSRNGLRAMAKENRSRLTSYSRKMGKIIPRQEGADNAGPLRTEAGLIIG